MKFLDVKFEQYDRENPKVYELFAKLAWKVYWTGRKRFGAKMIMERLRWEFIIETNDPDFKINNNYTSRYARKLMENNELLRSLFATRELR